MNFVSGKKFLFLALLFGIAFAPRILFLVQLNKSSIGTMLVLDSADYDAWAMNIARGDWIGTGVFYAMPLYPYFLGVVYFLFGHFLSAARFVSSSIFGFMNAEKSESKVSESTGGNGAASGIAADAASAVAMASAAGSFATGATEGNVCAGSVRAAALLRCDQRLSENGSDVSGLSAMCCGNAALTRAAGGRARTRRP